MHQLGFMEDLELEQLKLSLSQINTIEKRAVAQIRSSYNLLKFNMGFPMDDTLQLAETLESITELAIQNTQPDPKLILDDHIDYNLATLQEDLLHLNHRLTKSKRFPTIGASVQFSFVKLSFALYTVGFNHIKYLAIN